MSPFLCSHRSRDARLRFVLVPLLALTAVPFAASEAVAEGTLRALLVGVSAYETPMIFKPLVGPANDVALLAGSLRARGFRRENITILSEAADAQDRPTRAAILRELDRLAETAERGDIVYIHLSGHGSQQPNTNPDQDRELDGLDEIFLPKDAGLWADEARTIRNAIVDDEVAPRIAAVRGKGAFVLLVSDSCHSETAARAIPLNERDRGIEPEQLGIPPPALAAAAAQAPRTRGGDPEKTALDAAASPAEGAGGFVAFYAAQTFEEAPEMPLPFNAPQDVYGLFSYNLASVVAAHPGITYRQAIEQILHSYRTANRFRPTPIVEGADTDLDTVILGTSAGTTARQWPIEKEGAGLRLPAGQLHQIAEGTILAVVPEAATLEEAKVLGYVRVTKAGMLRSTIEPAAYDDRPAPTGIPDGAFARVVDVRFTVSLAVALPDPPPTPSAAEAVAWQELHRLRREGVKATRIDWMAEDAGAANLRLLVRDGKLWFLPPSGTLITEGPARTPFLTIPDASQGEEALARFRGDLAANLSKVAKVTTLFAMARELAGNELARGLEMTVEVHRAATGETETFALTDVPELYDEDVLVFRATNRGRQPLDLTALFIDSRFGIEAWFPYGGESNRLQPGETVSEDLKVNLETVGSESLLFIAAAVTPQAPRTDFAFLAQEGLRTRSGSSSAAAGSANVLDLLREAGVQEVRGSERNPPVDLAAASSFSWTVVPRKTEDAPRKATP